MRTNAFDYTTIPHGDDHQMVRGVLVKCRECPIVSPVRVNYMSGHSSSDDEQDFQFVKRRMEVKGWEISRKRDDHLCPACSTKHNAVAPKKTNGHANNGKAHDMKHPPTQVIKTLPEAVVRMMSREERRIIFEKLNEVYLNETVGYCTDWSDEKVARDLNVPQAWVRVIREENLGEESGNEALRASVNDVATFMETFRKVEPEIQKLMSLADKIEKNQAELLRRR